MGISGKVTGKLTFDRSHMPGHTHDAVAEHRRRLKHRGLARIELRAPREDAPLLHEIAGRKRSPWRDGSIE
jgi:hypothetical protein